MDPLKTNRVGSTSLEVPQLGFGTAPLGDMIRTMSQQQSWETLSAAWDAGIRFFDSAPWYGTGLSEQRLGHFLNRQSRDAFAVSTKVGRVLKRPHDVSAPPPEQMMWQGCLPFRVHFDYSHDGVLRSYEDSMQRMGLNRIDALVIHDLDHYYHADQEGVVERFQELESGGGFAALQSLKDAGEIAAIGAGINHTGMIPQFLERFEMDFFLVAMPYTLLDQDALDEELPRCGERGVSVVIGAVFSSGILATGVADDAQYGYADAGESVINKTRRIQEVCERHDVPLGAAALQFPLLHPAVVSVIPGADRPELISVNQSWIRWEIPGQLWTELKDEGLLRSDTPV